MTFRTAACIALIGLTALACGGGGGGRGGRGGAGIGASTSSLQSPWSDMGIPMDNGSVMFCDASTCTITYSAGDVEKLGEEYDKGITGAGWKLKDNTKVAMAGMFTAQYEKDGKTMSVAGADAAGMKSFSLVIQ